MSFDNVEDVLALSPIQEGLLFHTLSSHGEPDIYLDQISATIRGELDVSRFRSSWDALVERHGILRTAFLWDGLDEPLQIVRGKVEIPWRVDDWRNEAEVEAQWRSLIQRDRGDTFDLAEAPLLRMALVRLDDAEWRWLWSFHHLVLDGWSARLLLKELQVVYAALGRDAAPDLPPAFPYGAYLAYLAGRDPQASEPFWRQELQGFHRPVRLDAWVSPASGADGPGGSRQHTESLTADETRAVTDVARAHRLTVATVLQGAWALLLSRHSRERDVVFGVTSSGRPPELRGVENGIGLFINTLPLRVRVEPDAQLIRWLAELQRAQLAARRFESTPLTDVQRWSELPAGEALFDHILVIENHPSTEEGEASFELTDLEHIERSHYPLALLAVPGERLELIAVHDPARFDEAFIRRTLHHLRTLLRAFIEDPSRTLAKISLLGSEERRELLEKCNVEDPPLAEQPLIHEQIAHHGKVRGERLAAVCGEQTLSYGELEQRSARLADHLRSLGVGPDALVGLLVERRLEMVVGLLGILRAGGAYVPLDADYPSAHLDRLLKDAAPAVLLTCGDSVPPAAAGSQVVRLDRPETWTGRAEGEPEPIRGEHLAYVIFTSGSTGAAKGVMASHRNLLHSTAARLEVYPEPVEAFLLLSSIAFDSSVAGLFWTLTTAGTLVLPRPGEERDLDALARLVAHHRVTHTLALPALYRLLLDQAPAASLASLRVAVVAGEACPPELASLHHDLLPKAVLYNEYGPTEATVWATVHRIEPGDGDGPVPIGRRIPRMRTYVLDEDGGPVPTGVAGELYLAGEGVARGYWRRPQETAERFVTLELEGRRERAYRSGDLVCRRDDGRLLFLGRADSQVKVRGYRVEIEGVEAALRQHSEVGAAAAAVRDRRLVAWIVPQEGTAPGGAELRSQLADRLPDFMVPSAFTLLEELPRTPNGKVDRRALPDPIVHPETEGGAPEGEAEQAVALVWSQLLGNIEPRREHNFFELGGDSILGIQAVSRLRQAGWPAEPRDIAAHDSLAKLAAALRRRAPEDRDFNQENATDFREGDVPLAPIQSWFLERNLESSERWNLSRLFEVPGTFEGESSPSKDDSTARSQVPGTFGDPFGDLGQEDLTGPRSPSSWSPKPRHLEKCLEACLRRHPMLRARFTRDADGRWRQTVLPPEDVKCPVQVERASTEDERRRLFVAAQGSLRLDAAPLLRAVWIEVPGARAQVLVAAHHLVLDAVSWRILQQDLETALAQLATGQDIDLPAATTPYARWAQEQREPLPAAERDYWTAPVSDTDAAIPTDGQPEPWPDEGRARIHRSTVDEALVSTLFEEARRAYDLRPDETLITALALALRNWRRQDALLLDLERHGRDGGLDLTRTVGWLTAAFPVLLRLPPDAGPGKAIRTAKDHLRAVPGGGAGYGRLRYGDDPEIRRSLVARPEAQVLFNYLGRLDPPQHGATLRPIPGGERGARDPRAARSHLLEINAHLDDGLHLDWIFCEGTHRPSTLEHLAENFERQLRVLSDHCSSPEAGGLTASDFPDAGLDEGDFEHLLSQLESG